MNQARIRELVDQLDRLSKRYSVGFKNEVAIQEMNPLLRALEYECAENGYMSEKLAGARHNFEVMFSPRKHLKYGGAEEVAYRFRSDIHRVTKWLDNFMREENFKPEKDHDE